MCRSVGIPARYVSGYLPTALTPRAQTPDPNAAEVTTHAWVEVAIPGSGWWGLDPTNQQEVGASHVKTPADGLVIGYLQPLSRLIGAYWYS